MAYLNFKEFERNKQYWKILVTSQSKKKQNIISNDDLNTSYMFNTERTKDTRAKSPRKSRRGFSVIWMWLLVAGAHTARPWADRAEGCLTRERRLSWMWSSKGWKFLCMILLRKDSTEQFSRLAGFWKGPSLPWTNSWETSSLLNSTSSLTFSLVLSIPLPCLLKALQYGPQPPGATSKLRRSLFCFFSDSLLLYPWSLEPQGGFLEGFETGTWKNHEQLLLTVQTWGLRNRSEPFRTVPETSAPRKLARKINSVQRIPGVGRHGQGRAIPDAVVPTWEYESSNLWTHSRTPICYIEYVFRLNDAGKNPGKNPCKRDLFSSFLWNTYPN